MAFVKSILRKTGDVEPVEPLNEEIKTKIKVLIRGHLDNYEKNYDQEIRKVFKEWRGEGKKFTLEELDQEAHNRAGVKSLKETITNKTWPEIQDDVDKEVKTKTDNNTVIKVSNMAGKKTLGLIVGKSVDAWVNKITKKTEARKKSNK